MPSRPLDTGWDFGPVLDYIGSDSHTETSSLPDGDSAAKLPILSRNNLQAKTSQQSLRLGNFKKLFAELGITDDGLIPPISPPEPDSDESSGSAHSHRGAPSVQAKKAEPPADTSKVTNAIFKTTSQDEVPPYTPTKTSGSLALAGLSKKQKKRARKLQLENEREKTEPPTVLDEVKVDRLQDSEARPAHISIPGPTKSKALARKESESKQESRAPSRSNVSAKIRPATPVKALGSKNSKDAQNPLATTFVPNDSRQPLLPTAQAPLGKPFSPSKPQVVSDPQPEKGYFPVQSTTSVVAAQHAVVPLPMPYEHLSTPSRAVPSAYYTPQAQKPILHSHGLIPRTVQPAKVQRPQPVVAPQQQAQHVPHAVVYPTPMHKSFTPGRTVAAGPITIRPKVDRNFHFFNQLLVNHPEDVKWLVSPMQLCNEKPASEGIHVFVDASNILIGFRWAMKRYRVAPFEISFDSLALLMERRRPVAKREFAGSHREANPLPYVTKLQEVSKAVGYQNTIKEQVFICREESERKKFFKDVEKMGFQKAVEKSKRGGGSGNDSSDSETGAAAALLTPSTPRWVEQGVDEILHLKMCQSIIDTEVPTTMVLATGDGAEAEHSDGFLAHVERAMKKGWKIELVSWRQQTNGGYRNKKFRAKWGDQFKIIELDDYLEALIDTP